jgi:uncharacterized protein YdhG (YjbR/CyaY superfamily)
MKKAATIAAYLASVPPPQRRALKDLRKKILAVVPDAEECISYGIPAFRVDGRIVAGFCARAKGCSYFPFSGTTLATVAAHLADHEKTKSSLHFPVDAPLSLALVRRLIRARLAESR